MKETTVTETRIGIEGSGAVFTRAEVTLGAPGHPKVPAIVILTGDEGLVRIWKAEEAAELAQVFTRIHELLDGHEKQLALRDCASALSNTSEHGGPETPVA